ncbi:MAG: site-2 protease family protein [Hyphomicrobiaceae bacterium]|nr:site-2 protease family protein [Hyphomicrobiaceae bacterium]
MNTKLELGRIAGIPIFLDMFFVLVLLFFSHRYFTGNDSIQLSAGIIIIAGIIASVLLHELAHAAVARLFRVGIEQIELTGLGGVIQFSSSLPSAALPRMAIYLAGPAMNYALYLGAIEAMAPAASLAAEPRIILFVLGELAIINLFLCVFNLLPAFPLDGGHALDALLGKLAGPSLGRRIVGALGIVVAIVIALFAIQGLPGSIFLLLLAFFIAEMNWSAVQDTTSR